MHTTRRLRRPATPPSRRATVALAVLLAAATGCATTGATLNSGVGDAFPRQPPWVAGADPSSAGARLGHLPLRLELGEVAGLTAGTERELRDAAQPLLDALDRRLDSIAAATGLSIRLVEGGRYSAVASRAADQPPDVRFGCVIDPRSALDECAVSGDTVLGRETYGMQLTVGRPSREWIDWAGGVMGERGVDAVLVLALEPGQYLPQQAGLRGDKYVQLGAGHRVALPWLTSLETPVTVLQLTGALVRPDGRAVRIAAEGIMVRRTSLPASAVGLQRILAPDDLRAALGHRRDDLRGAPPAWAVALDELLANLTGATGS